MASGSASSPRPAPDENEFPFGCPPTACQDPPEPGPLCTVCLSEKVRNDEDRICPKCKGDDTPSESPGSLLSQEKDHPEVAEAGVGCPFAGVGCSFKGSPKFVEEHEVTSQAAHLNLLLGFMKQWKAQLGSGLGYGPMALERNLSDLQLQGAVEVAGDLEVDCYRAPCSESQDDLALHHFMKEKLLTELEGKLCVFENIVAVLNKEVEASHLALAASIHQSQLDREHILSLEQRVSLGGSGVAADPGPEGPGLGQAGAEPAPRGGGLLRRQLPLEDHQRRPAVSRVGLWQDRQPLLPSFLHRQVWIQAVPAAVPEWGRDGEEDPPVPLHRDHERGVRCSAAMAFQEQGWD
nr:TNF receptor-associated factor 1 isoform X6 [Bubalus bubalis]